MKVIIAMLMCLSAFAHFKVGTYQGVSETGKTCAFTIHAPTFVNNNKNPLTERVKITFNGMTKEFRHLLRVDDKTKKVRPKPEVLTALLEVLPKRKGAIATELHMDDKGPFKFVTVYDFWSDPGKSFTHSCTKLFYTQK